VKRAEYILAFDEGTTGTRVIAFDRAGRVRSVGYAELPLRFPHPGWVEQRGEEIWAATLRALRQALRPIGGARASIAAIGITNQRETTLIWDRGTSKPVAPAIVWQDRRTAARCDALRRAGKERAIQSRTGLRLDPYFSATKVEWILRNVAGVRARARRGQLAFGTVDTWLLWKLTAGASHATDATNASRTMLYDIRHHRWDPSLLRTFSIPRSLLPEVRPSISDFGKTSGVPGLRDGIPILGIAGDQQAALFGQGCVEAGGMKNTYGTGCFLLLHTGRKRIASPKGLLVTIACGPRGEPRYALEGSVFMAGATIQWLRDALGVVASASETEAIARSVPDTAGTTLVPAFAGLGAPYWKPDARGVWCGLTRGATRAHLVRAALESIAFQSRDLVEAMRDASRDRVRELRVDGGASHNDFLMQFQADILGVPVRRPGMVETTALGASLLAGIGAGWWRRASDLQAVRASEKVFRPRMKRAERDRLYRGWIGAVEMLLSSRGS